MTQAGKHGTAHSMRLPREARDGIMRVWLEILRERYPGVTWIPVEQDQKSLDPRRDQPARRSSRG